MTLRPLQQSVIRMLRRKAALTQRELAFLMGHGTGFKVSQCEAGHQVPQYEEMIAIECIFDVAHRVICPSLYAETLTKVMERARTLRDRHVHRSARMTEERAAYKAERLEQMLAAIERHASVQRAAEKRVW